MKHVLVTGGCGFIGVNLIRFLLNNTNWSLKILDNLSTGSYQYLDDLKDEGRVDFYEGDICNLDDVNHSICDCDGVVHLAARPGVYESVSDPYSVLKTNVTGTFNMLDAAVRYKCSRFVFVSSNAVLGDQNPPLHNGLPSVPLSPYGASKMAGEGFTHAYGASFGLNSVVLRLSNVYGPYADHKDSVIHRFIRQCIKGEKMSIFGDGLQRRDFIFVDDVCRAIYQCLLKNSVGGVFHIGSGVGTSVKELASMVSSLKDGGCSIVYEDARMGEVDSSYVDCSHAESVLGFKCSVGLKDGLGLTRQWFENNSNSQCAETIGE